MPADESYIRQALEKHLAAISGVPAIAFENVPFDPSALNEYLRAKLIFIEQRPSAVGVGVKTLHRGLFLIDCFVRQEKTANGPARADEIAGTVRDAFSYGTILTEGGNQIRIRFAERAEGRDDAPWYFVPVTVEWYSFIA